MKRIPVQSSNLRSVGYDPSSEILEIEFLHGGVYQYHDVPASVHEELMAASSHGSYFDEYIKHGGYHYIKIG
jgi:KTSC domain